MNSITKLAGRKAVASCLPGALELCGTGIPGAAEARLAQRGLALASERPFQAPAAVAAQASAYVPAANGADLQWSPGGAIFAGGTTFAAEHHTMRAFRGLQPWRDPA
jgi:hypothetical protein